jgi:CubicO group peptidase (beta-lactamase class C family)
MNQTLESGIAGIMRGRVPGLSVAVVRPQSAIWTKGLGFADLVSQAPATPDTLYSWFSMTKLVTATCLMRLVESGLIDLDEPVIGRYPLFRSMRPSRWAESVTIRNLLNHTSGLANPIPITWIHMADVGPPDPDRFLAGLMAKCGTLRDAPGTTVRYSNLGYLVLGRVIAAVTGKSYQEYVRSDVLEPLGMASTGFSVSNALVRRAATGYQKRWSPMTPLLRLMLPAGVLATNQNGFISLNRFYVDGDAYGGLIGSVVDAARFLGAQLHGDSAHGARMLTPASLERMQTLSAHGPKLDVGLGWYRRRATRRSGGDFIEHLGGGGGYFAAMRIYLASSLGVVVLGNATAYDHDAIVARLADAAFSGAL